MCKTTTPPRSTTATTRKGICFGEIFEETIYDKTANIWLKDILDRLKSGQDYEVRVFRKTFADVAHVGSEKISATKETV